MISAFAAWARLPRDRGGSAECAERDPADADADADALEALLAELEGSLDGVGVGAGGALLDAALERTLTAPLAALLGQPSPLRALPPAYRIDRFLSGGASEAGLFGRPRAAPGAPQHHLHLRAAGVLFAARRRNARVRFEGGAAGGAAPSCAAQVAVRRPRASRMLRPAAA